MSFQKSFCFKLIIYFLTLGPMGHIAQPNEMNHLTQALTPGIMVLKKWIYIIWECFQPSLNFSGQMIFQWRIQKGRTPSRIKIVKTKLDYTPSAWQKMYNFRVSITNTFETNWISQNYTDFNSIIWETKNVCNVPRKPNYPLLGFKYDQLPNFK